MPSLRECIIAGVGEHLSASKMPPNPEVTNTLNSVWSRKSLHLPTHLEYSVVDEARHRIIAFVPVEFASGVRHIPMRLWYEMETENSVRSRLDRKAHGQVHSFRFEGVDLVWKFSGMDCVFKHVAPDDYPEWLLPMLAKAHAKMDEIEFQAEQ